MKRGPILRSLLLLAIVACGSASSPASSLDSGVSNTWSSVLQNLTANGTSIYSFRFDSAPPIGAFYTLAIHDVDATTACGRYGANVPNSEFWQLAITVNDMNTGTHAISLSLRDGTPSATANITLLHRKQGEYIEAYNAVSGSLSLASNPSPQDAKQDMPLRGHIEADFPSHAVQEVSCQGGVGRDGGDAFSACNCRDSNGVSSTCTPGSEGQNCCNDLTSSRIHVSFSFIAISCPNMCRWAAGLSTDYCYQYFGH